jgi:hypothetical protein
MTWTNDTLPETAWDSSEAPVQVIEFIDNNFEFNYPFVNINGQQIVYWPKNTTPETAWVKEIV